MLLCLSDSLFRISTRALYSLLCSVMLITCPAHSILFDTVIPVTSTKDANDDVSLYSVLWSLGSPHPTRAQIFWSHLVPLEHKYSGLTNILVWPRPTRAQIFWSHKYSGLISSHSSTNILVSPHPTRAQIFWSHKYSGFISSHSSTNILVSPHPTRAQIFPSVPPSQIFSVCIIQHLRLPRNDGIS